jgi:hypothetical protein
VNITTRDSNGDVRDHRSEFLKLMIFIMIFDSEASESYWQSDTCEACVRNGQKDSRAGGKTEVLTGLLL